jgi:5-formyltetrahydrofolate cyclo-ligase
MAKDAKQTADNEPGSASFASPPCFMHEADPAYSGLTVDPRQSMDVARWRKAERERLIAARLALPIDVRTEHARLLARDLDHLIAAITTAPVVSLYWPFRGEPDLRPWMEAACARGVRVALPIVVEKAQPLVFREWQPGCTMARGVWNIPYPENGTPLEPGIVIAPLVGFDPAGYRLGYGGGFFDRTLAALTAKPVAIGVGHPVCAIPTIYPQPHDIPMDWIVTGVEAPRQRVDPPDH